MKSKGFTLIELLVVIAIIGILSSVVLASLSRAREKGLDSAIKFNLSNLRSQASLWYDENGQVYAVVGDEYILGNCPIALETNINILSSQKFFEGIFESYTKSGDETKSQCVVTETAWAVAVELKTADGEAGAGVDAWCVDSLGNSRAYTYAPSETIADAINVDECK